MLFWIELTGREKPYPYIHDAASLIRERPTEQCSIFFVCTLKECKPSAFEKNRKQSKIEWMNIDCLQLERNGIYERDVLFL